MSAERGPGRRRAAAPATLEEAEAAARRLAATLRESTPRGWGFALVLAEYGEAEGLTYLSSYDRSTVPRLLREVASRLETGEGSLGAKAYDDPLKAKLFELLSVAIRVLTCPGVGLSVDAADLGGDEEAHRLAAAMVRDFVEALRRVVAQGTELILEYDRELLRDDADDAVEGG